MLTGKFCVPARTISNAVEDLGLQEDIGEIASVEPFGKGIDRTFGLKEVFEYNDESEPNRLELVGNVFRLRSLIGTQPTGRVPGT